MAPANATLFFTDGKTLAVAETQTEIIAAMIDGVANRGGALLTKTNGERIWANLAHVCRIDPS